MRKSNTAAKQQTRGKTARAIHNKSTTKLTQNEQTFLGAYRRIKSQHAKFAVFVLVDSIANGTLSDSADKWSQARLRREIDYQAASHV